MTRPLCRCGAPAVAPLSRIYGARRIGENLCATCERADLRLASSTANIVLGAVIVPAKETPCQSILRTEAAIRPTGNASSAVSEIAQETGARAHRLILTAGQRMGSRIQ